MWHQVSSNMKAPYMENHHFPICFLHFLMLLTMHQCSYFSCMLHLLIVNSHLRKQNQFYDAFNAFGVLQPKYSRAY